MTTSLCVSKGRPWKEGFETLEPSQGSRSVTGGTDVERYISSHPYTTEEIWKIIFLSSLPFLLHSFSCLWDRNISRYESNILQSCHHSLCGLQFSSKGKLSDPLTPNRFTTLTRFFSVYNSLTVMILSETRGLRSQCNGKYG